jgi:hypothetical protein
MSFKNSELILPNECNLAFFLISVELVETAFEGFVRVPNVEKLKFRIEDYITPDQLEQFLQNVK